MSLLSLPPEILYDILGEVVASYIDRAITSPPIGGWETMESEGRSEWYTDDDDSSNGDTDLDIDSNDNGSDDDNTSDQDVDSDSDDYDSVSSDEDDTSLSNTSADDELSDIGSDASPSLLPTPCIRPPEDFVRSAEFVGREQAITDASIVVDEAATVYLDSEVPNNALSLWALEQERRSDPDDIPAFKLFLWDIIERREKLPTNDIASLLSVCHSVREITCKLVSDALGFDNNAKERYICLLYSLSDLSDCSVPVPSTTRGLFYAFFADTTALHIRSHSTFPNRNTQLG